MKFSRQLSLTAVIAAFSLSACTTRTVLNDLNDFAQDRPSSKEMHVWFVKPSGEELRLVSVIRERGSGELLSQSVEELLRGPTDKEISSGIGSEIPRGTILLGIDKKGDQVELNLSRRFASGGGTSLETRLEQLRRTVAESAGDKKVFLSVEGQRLSATAGDGLEVKQPIN